VKQNVCSTIRDPLHTYIICPVYDNS